MKPSLFWFGVFRRSFIEIGILKLFTLGGKATNVLTGWQILALSLDFWNLFVLESPPSELQRLIFDDIFGTCMLRNLRVT
jgi:hypothetical protein